MASRTLSDSTILNLPESSRNVQKGKDRAETQRSQEDDQMDSSSEGSIYSIFDSESDSEQEENSTQQKRRIQPEPSTSKKRTRAEDWDDVGRVVKKRAVSNNPLGPKPLTLEGKARSHHAHKAKRREKHQQKIVSRGPRARDAVAPLIVDNWLDTLSGMVDHWRQVQKVHERALPALDCIQELVHLSRVRDSVVPIDDSSSLWQHTAQVIPMLQALSLDPIHFNPVPWLESGALIECFPGDEKNTQFQKFYIRILELDVATAIQAAYNYLVHSPADAEWAIFRLLALGEKMPDILARLETALESCGHGATVRSFAELAEGLNTTSVVSLATSTGAPCFMYIGTTSKNVYGRCADDKSARWTRYTNVNNANKELFSETTWRVFRIPGLDVPIDGPLAIRVNPLISAIEATLIDVCSGLSTNSARGGYTYYFSPEPTLADTVSRAFACAPPQNLGATPLDDTTKQAVHSLVADEVKYWAAAGVFGGKTLSPRAQKSVLKDLLGMARTIDGRIVQMIVADDIPCSAFDGTAGGIWDSTAGRGFQEYRETLGLMYPEISSSCEDLRQDLTENQIAQYISPMVNLWRVIPEKTFRTRHVAFLSRILVALQPLLIETLSATVASAFRESELKKAFQACQSADGQQALARFWAGKSNIEDMTFLFPHDEHLSQMGAPFKEDEFTKIQGEIYTARYGPDPTHIALSVPMRQASHFSYDPRFSRLRHDLQYLVHAKKDIPARVVANRLSSDPQLNLNDAKVKEAFLTECKTITENITSNAGIEGRLAAVKESLRSAELAVMHLRSIEISGNPSTVRPKMRSPPQPCKEILFAATGREVRLTQLAELREDMTDRVSRGVEALPHLILFGMEVSSDAFRDWFLNLKDSCNIAASVRMYGNSEGARSRQVVNQARLGVWRHKDAEDRHNNPELSDPTKVLAKRTANIKAELDGRRALLTEAVRALSTLEGLRGLKFKKGNIDSLSTIDTWRYVTCQACHAIVIGKDKNSKHICGAAADVNAWAVTLTETNFPDISRLLYAHDIFDKRTLCSILSRSPADLDLVAHSAVLVLEQNPTFFDSAPASIRSRVATVPGSVYVPKGCALDDSLTLTLAFDKALRHLSVCSVDWAPPAPHEPWSKYSLWQSQGRHLAVLNMFKDQKGLKNRLFLGKCNYGWYCIIPNPHSRNGAPPYSHRHNCNITSTTKKTQCSTCQFIRVHSIWDLAPDFSRRPWFLQHVQNVPGYSVHEWTG